MVRWLPLPLFLAACASAPPAPTPTAPPAPSSAPAPATSAKAAASTAAPQGAPSKRPTSGNLPGYARLDVDPTANYPERARLVRAGRFATDWPPSDKEKEALAQADQNKVVDWEPPVIEIGTTKRPYRLLCRNADIQVAAFADPSLLATVAKEATSLHPNARPPAAPGDKEPGVRITKGTRLTVLGSATEVDHLRFESIGLTGEGYVRRAQLGLTFKPDTGAVAEGAAGAGGATEHFDATLAGSGGALLPEPKRTARAIATLTAYPENEGVHRFVRLGPKQGGFSLVRLIHPETSVVGWIEDAALKPESGNASWSKEQKTGESRLTGSKMIKLHRGDLLMSDRGDAIGVVLSDHDTPCVARCDLESPRVAVRACGGNVRANLVR